MTRSLHRLLPRAGHAAFVALAVSVSAHSAPLSLQDVPLYLSSRADPNVLINMSVETPMGGAAYNDNVGIPAGCGGRIGGSSDLGSCYFATTTYLGYFDPEKCYDYSASDWFVPASAATNHACSGRWSGNFLNWASMTAIDMFIWTMTGGNRVVDSTSNTVIRRARKQDNNSWFPRKVLKSTINVPPSTVTPFGDDTLYIYNTSFGFRVGTTLSEATSNDPDRGYYDARVKVCVASVGLEANCVAYGSPAYYKPEGSIQRNALSKRFAAIGYTLDGSQSRDGGVLRSNMKYVGPNLRDGSTNPAREYGTDGILRSNPDGASGLNSGVINYINKFSDPGYKSHDPVAELFYESIRYFKNLGPTPEYSSGLAAGQDGGFQIVNDWTDPQQYRCQKNFVIAINDANPWLDKSLPGTFFTTSTISGSSGTVTLAGEDYGPPSNADTSINVTTLTNKVGQLEGLNGATWSNSGTWTSGTATGTNDSVGGGVGTFDNSCTTKTVSALGEVMGTCPFPGKQNSYYVAGLALYANTTDLRSDFANDRGIQNVTSFFIDTQEFNSNPLDGPKNMLWLAGKYGGFVDENEDGIPQANEWDADSDGVPDNYVLATQPQNLVEGLDHAFDFIDRQISSASSASVNSGSISDGTRIYQAKFNSGDWTGQLLSFSLDAQTGEIAKEEWDASDHIPDPADRQIITLNTDGSPVPFHLDDLDDTRLTQLNADKAAAQLMLDYLRGDSSREGTLFRIRSDAGGDNKLGDIISSAPVFVGRPAFRYRDTLEAKPYSVFADTDRGGMVYVGANDGMLHGFDATSGEEKFAFIPSPVFERLPNLASPNYSHQYYVDGSPSMGDVFFSDTWHTVLVGGLNKGGQGIYALDITNPQTLAAAEANAADIVLWEFTDQNDADLGLTYSQPSIVKLRDGSWAAVFGNGYNSTEADGTPSATGNAVLYIVNVATGELIRKLDTKTGNAQRPSGVAWDNGLATPALVDTNGDRIVEYAYAGDLYGNMWKFDLSDVDSAKWEIAFGTADAPLPLYQARDASGNAQPITVRPEITRGPGGAGMVVLFGTGKYLEASDTDTSPQREQTFYGIIDHNTDADSDRVAGRDELTAQSILAELTVDPPDPDGPSGPRKDPGPFDVRVNSNEPLGTNSGWYLDLVSPEAGYQGEKQVSNPIVRNGNVIFTTLIPESNPCSSGGRSWIMEMNVLNGGRLEKPPFDINNDGQFTDADRVTITIDAEEVLVQISGLGSTEGILQSPGVIDGDQGEEGRQSLPVQYKYLPGSHGGIQQITENPGIGSTGRQSWRQIR